MCDVFVFALFEFRLGAPNDSHGLCIMYVCVCVFIRVCVTVVLRYIFQEFNEIFVQMQAIIRFAVCQLFEFDVCVTTLYVNVMCRLLSGSVV